MLAFLMSKVGTERQLAADVFLSSKTWSHPHAGDFLNLAYGCSSFQMGWASWGNCENIELLSELHPCWIGGKWQVIGESKGAAPCYLCFPDHYCSCQSFYFDVVAKSEQIYVSIHPFSLVLFFCGLDYL